MTDKPMQVAVYARISTKDGRQHTENQLREMTAYAEKMEWKIAGVYVDEESGAKGSKERIALHQLLDAAARRHFDRVLVWSLSRLTREGVAQTFAYIRRLKANGIDLWSLTEEQFRTTGPAGELFIAIAAYIAEQERAQHIERVRAGISRARADGQPIGRPRIIADAETLRHLSASLTIRQIAAQTGLSKSTVLRRLQNKPKS